MAAFRRQIPDRVPVMQMALYHGIRLLGKKLSAIHDLDVAIGALAAVQKRYMPDIMTPSFGCKYWLYGDLGIELRMPEDGFDSVQEAYFTSRKDLETKPLPDPSDPDTLLHNQIRLVRAISELFGNETVVASFGGSSLGRAGDLVGNERLLAWLIEDPDLARLAIQRVSEWTLAIAKASLDVGAEVIGMVDPTAGGSVISRNHFEQFSLPILRELNAEIKNHKDVPTYLHICGKVDDRIDLMVETGVDGLSFDQNVNLAKAKRDFGDKVCLIGNVDPVGVLFLGSPEDVTQTSRVCIEQAGEGGGFILAPGCGVPPDAPVENLLALHEAAHRYGQYPLG